MEAGKIHGTNWSDIAKLLPGRTGGTIKYRLQAESTGTGPVPGVPGPGIVGPLQKPGPGWSPM